VISSEVNIEDLSEVYIEDRKEFVRGRFHLVPGDKKSLSSFSIVIFSKKE
jgi:hypothetical protein